MKLIEIASGWYNFIHGNEKVRKTMEYRLSVCDTCPHKLQLSPAGERLLQMVNEDASVYYCGSCGCPLATKTYSPSSECPLGKWSSTN